MPKANVPSSLICLTLLMMAGGIAAPFIAPQEGPVAFRRDRLPLDPETMTTLSEQLRVLAIGQGKESAEGRRATAQMLALALALHPANAQARTLVNRLTEETEDSFPDDKALERSRARIWNTLAWLETPEAGVEGNALAACLADVISASDPNHPRSATFRETGEKGAWNGWIAPLNRFQETKTSENEPVNEEPAPTEPVATVSLKLEKAVISTPLWSYDLETKSNRLMSVPVSLMAEPTGGDFTFSLENTAPSKAYTRINRTLAKALAKEHGGLPTAAKITLICGEEADYLFGRNRNAISGAAAVLMSAAITGREPDATVIGLIQEDGTFTAPPDFWDRLRSLMSSRSPGGRLVIPAESADAVASLLALEQPEFFFKYEVLTAANLTELLERSAKVPTPELQEISVKFFDIREKGATQPLSQYVVNRFVRQRLIDLSAEAPFHLSAKMLAIQAAGERPTRLPKNLLAFEYRRAIAPMAWIPKEPLAVFDIEKLDQTYEICRAEVDLLERYVDTSERDFHTRVRDLATSMRTFSRASRVRTAEPNGRSPIAVTYDAMIRSYAAINEELAALTGDEGISEPPPP